MNDNGMIRSKVVHFTDLVAWQEGHKLVLEIYRITKDFPTKENFILNSQMLRCVISITSNIAEGFSRKGKKEKIQFYSISLGSLTELQNQLIIARDLHYKSVEKYNMLDQQTNFSHKLINGLIKSAQDR
jgi:four helix bundle protein